MQNRTFFSLAVAVSLAFSAAGCGSRKELSRGRAQELLEEHPSLKSVSEIELRDFQTGVAEGWWLKDGTPGPEIADVVERVEWARMTLRKPFHRTVQITGIADTPLGEGRTKSVEFTWDYQDLSPGIKHWGRSPEPSLAKHV